MGGFARVYADEPPPAEDFIENLLQPDSTVEEPRLTPLQPAPAARIYASEPDSVGAEPAPAPQPAPPIVPRPAPRPAPRVVPRPPLPPLDQLPMPVFSAHVSR